MALVISTEQYVIDTSPKTHMYCFACRQYRLHRHWHTCSVLYVAEMTLNCTTINEKKNSKLPKRWNNVQKNSQKTMHVGDLW